MGDGNPNPFRKTEHYYQSSEWTGYSQPQYTDPNYRPESYPNSEPMKYLPYDNNYNTYVPSNSHGYGQSNSHYAPPNSHNYALSNSHNYLPQNPHNIHTNPHSMQSSVHSIQSNPHSMQSNVPNYGQSTHPVDTVNLPYQSQVIDAPNISYSTRQIPTDPVSVQYKHDSIPMRYNTYPMNSVNPNNSVNNVNPVNNMNQVNPVNSANSMGFMNYYNQRNMSGYKNDSDVNYYQNYMYYSGRVPGRAASDVSRPEIHFSRNYENLANKNFFNASLSFKEAATAMLSMDANKKTQSRQRTPNRGRGSARGLEKVQKTENTTQTTSILDQSVPRVEQNVYQKYSNTKTMYQPQASKNIEPTPAVQFSQYNPAEMSNRADVINRMEMNNRVGDMNRMEMNRMNMNRVEMNRGDMVKQGEMGGKDSGYNNYFMINSKINSPEYAKYRNRGLQQLTQYNLMSQYSQQHGIGNYISNVNNYPNVNNFPTVNNYSNVNNYPNVNRNFKKIGPNAIQGPPRFIPPIHKPVPPLRNEPINKLHVIEEIHADNDYMNNIKTNSISSACSLMESFQHSLSNKRKRIRNCLVEDCRNVIGEQPKIDIQYSSTEVNGKKRYFLPEILSSLLPYHVFYCDELEQPETTKFDYSEIKDQIKQVQQNVENISNNNDYSLNQSVNPYLLLN
uniref:Uncharacterized protein n=1 Tax=Theileria annulata TaxID=5874 RepID=A0A3B0N350_THEAN